MSLAVAAVVIAGAWPSSGSEQLEKELVIVTGGGAYEQALKEHFFDPFTKATGVKVISVAASPGERWAKIKAMAQAGLVEWDMTLSVETGILANQNLLARIDCTAIPNAAAQGLPDACQEWGPAGDDRRQSDGLQHPGISAWPASAELGGLLGRQEVPRAEGPAELRGGRKRS